MVKAWTSREDVSMVRRIVRVWSHESRRPMKTQFKEDFLAEFASNNQTIPNWWNLYVDDTSNMNGSRTWIILEGHNNITLEQALKLNFKASNNHVEYEAIIAGLKLAKKVRAKKLRCYTDSQLIQGKVAKRYQTKELILEGQILCHPWWRAIQKGVDNILAKMP